MALKFAVSLKMPLPFSSVWLLSIWLSVTVSRPSDLIPAPLLPAPLLDTMLCNCYGVRSAQIA